MPGNDIERICFECDYVYTGGLRCPVCGESAGEPVKQLLDDILEEE